MPKSAPPTTDQRSAVVWLAVTDAVIVPDRSVGTVSVAGVRVTVNSYAAIVSGR